MLKKTILILLSLVIVLSSLVYSAADDMVADNITINFPTDLTYNASTGAVDLNLLNATVRWNANTKNITNVSFVFTSGTIRYVFTNTTLNGTGGTILGSQKGDFTYRIQPDDLTINTKYTVRVEIRNSTELGNDGAVNSSAITYTLDSIPPSVTLEKPNNRQTVSVKGGGNVIFEYKPSDTNLGNSTLYVDGQPVKSSTSGTTLSNLTSGATNTFKIFYNRNNLSRNWIVEITDLAGLKANSSSFTYNVFAQGAPEPATVFVTPSGEVISSPAQPKGKPLALGNIGNVGGLLSNPFVWGGAILIAVGFFIYWQNKRR